MSVDFFPCQACGDSICDAGTYYRCEECYKVLCEECESTHVTHGDGEPECPFCRRELATNGQLLTFALGKLGMTREKLLEEYAAGGISP